MRTRHYRTLGLLAACVTLVAGLGGPAFAATPAPPKHMVWAQRLVNTVVPSANDYGDPAQITWKTSNGLDHSTNRSKCASLVTQMLGKAYGDGFVSWLGCKSPIAAWYHDAIEVENGFMLVEEMHDVQIGDIIAISYIDAGCTSTTCSSFKGCSTSGHVALVASRPLARIATSPIIPGTVQFAVEVIDSSRDIHGDADTRAKSEALGADDQGVGRGTMRLYVDSVDPAHPIVGHTWSTRSGSVFYPHAKRDLVIGRVRR